MNTKNIHIGTSGWYYAHWDTVFYPEKIKSDKRLNYYSHYFSSVEINSTFYRLPTEKTVKNWFKQVQDNFLFSIKASQYITHRKRLKDYKKSTERFFKILKYFGPKRGPVLFQLPPSFQINPDRLEEFISHLANQHQCVFEFRHKSWYCDEIYQLLNKYRIGLCITDLAGQLSPEVITSDFTYVRLHGPKAAYKGSYGTRKLKEWKKKIESWSNAGVAVYCYFDNVEKGYAIQDAKKLIKLFESQ